jgi:Rab-GTPase-TBC domain
MPALSLRVVQFNFVVKQYQPLLWYHLRSFSLDVIAQQWIMTLFAYYLDFESLSLVWDNFLLGGWTQFYDAGLVLLQDLVQKGLLSANSDKIAEMMQSKQQGVDINEFSTFDVSSQDLIKASFSFLVRNLILAYPEAKNFLLEIQEDLSRSSAKLDLPGMRLVYSKETWCIEVESISYFAPSRPDRKGFTSDKSQETAHKMFRIPLSVLEDPMNQVRGLEESHQSDVSRLKLKIESLQPDLDKARGLVLTETQKSDVIKEELAQLKDQKDRVVHDLSMKALTTKISSGNASADIKVNFEWMANVEKTYFDATKRFEAQLQRVSAVQEELNEAEEIRNEFIMQLASLSQSHELKLVEIFKLAINSFLE